MRAARPTPRFQRNEGRTLALAFALSVAINAAALALPGWIAGTPEGHVFLLVATGEQAAEAARAAELPSPPEERRFAEERTAERERPAERKPDRSAPPGSPSPAPFIRAAPPEDAPETPEAAREKPAVPKRSSAPRRPPEAPAPEAPRGVRRSARRSEGFAPTYPRESRVRGESGVVLVAATVGADGVCVSARIERSSGFPRLDNAALDTVRQSRFEPATLDGRPVASEERLEIAFELE